MISHAYMLYQWVRTVYLETLGINFVKGIAFCALYLDLEVIRMLSD